MSLTTPEKFDQNDIYTEEGLFLYWKTASVLWNEVISTNVFQKYLIIPVSWPSHTIGNQLDFGEKRKELDLNRLIKIGNKHGKSVILLFSISPNSLHLNGGVPSSLATQNLVTKGGLFSYSVNGDEIVKHYSFFDTKIYRAFSEFMKKVKLAITEPLNTFSVITGEFGSINGSEFQSFFNDYGNCFKRSFDQYLTGLEEREKKTKRLGEMKSDFTSFVKSLYFKEVHRNFHSAFLTHQAFGIVNGGEKMGLLKMFSEVSNIETGKQILDAYVNELFPLTINVNKVGRNEIFSTQIKQLINATFLDYSFNSFCSAEDSIDFLPMSLFVFVGGKDKIDYQGAWLHTGLISFIEESYGRCFNSKLVPIERIRDRYLLNKVLFIKLNELSKKDLFIMKDIFYSGAQIVIDIEQGDDEKSIFLKEFLSSRDIKKEVVNIGAVISVYTTSNSTILVVDSSSFRNANLDKSIIWRSVMRALSVSHLNVNSDKEGVITCWRSRLAKPNEMDFDEIRRLSLYNMTDYKKDHRFKIQEGFYLLKSVDNQNVSFIKEDQMMVMSFSPKSSISLDFGIVYE